MNRCRLAHFVACSLLILGATVSAYAAGDAPAAPAAADQASQPIVERIEADSPRVTSRGIAYTAPAAWSLSAAGVRLVLTAQEGDSHVAIIEATSAEPDAAVAEAWGLYRPAPPPALKLVNDLPARDGWDQAKQYDYESSPNEKRFAFASALRHGANWTVVVFDASEATANKRSAEFGLLLESIRPKDYVRETFAGKTANKLDAARLAKLDSMIELARAELGIPGISIAVVQDGKLVQAKGYGLRELGKPTPVDADSLYMIASNTKALSTLLLAQLVDDGKLRWDQPVVEVYPAFKLGDASTTAATQIQHLVCACTGLPRKDFDWLFEFDKATPLTEMKYLAGVQPTTKFGETFQYSNLLAAAAGFTAAHVLSPSIELGKAYDAAMQARIFSPLGMKSTTFDYKQALKGNHASPHSWNIDGKTAVAPMDLNYSIYPLRPAGGGWSSANDLIKYVQLELANGVTPSGQRIVSQANLLKRRERQVPLGEDAIYGMGLEVDRSYGVPVVHHGGSMIGFKSDMLWLPENGVGAVILTNSDLGGPLLGLFRRYLLELLFDGKPEAIENIKAASKTLRASLAAERPRLAVPADAKAVSALAKRYVNDALGPIDVKASASTTTFDFGEWRSAVASRTNDDGTLSFVAITPGQDGFNFVVGKSTDGKRTLTLRDSQHEYVFVEVVR